jgi:molybdate transport system ATP-binding protein
MQTLLELIDVSVSYGTIRALQNITLTIHQGEQWAIAGNSGSGKTTLAHTLAGRTFHTGEVRLLLPQTGNHRNPVSIIEQQHHLKTSLQAGDFYYQQRFHSVDANDAMTVEQLLDESSAITEKQKQYWLEILHITSLLQRPLIQLSNGENKRLQIVRALFEHSAILLLDNPFIGLDVEGRSRLNEILKVICAEGIHIILFTSRNEIPDCITHVAELENGNLVQAVQKEHYRSLVHSVKTSVAFTPNMVLKHDAEQSAFSTAIKMVDVTVRYGEKIILDSINWEVKRGECWSVSGPNGAGKSTLLSLITADNPQAYANELYLFDRRRGTGESIWDIKRNMGFVSPELHLYFPHDALCSDVIASGLFDSIGVFRKISSHEQQQVEWWIDSLQFQKIHSSNLSSLSLGQQRMIFLARALIKNPPLLIMDEPCQGLDEGQTASFKQLVDDVCHTFHTTLIYVSHIESDIPSCVTYGLRMERGRIVACSSHDVPCG